MLSTSDWLAKALQTFVGLIFAATILALLKAIFWRKLRYAAGVPAMPDSKLSNKGMFLTNKQLGLLGVKPKVEGVQNESTKKPPKSKSPPTSSDLLVPLHQPIHSPTRSPRIDSDGSNSSRGGKGRAATTTPSKSPVSSLYLVPGNGMTSPPSSLQSSGGMDSVISSPWSNRRAFSASKITSEEKLEQFLAEVDEKINESAGKLSTPPPTVSGFGIASPNTTTGSANTSGTTRLTPLRPVRMSPGSQKFSTPPKKGGSDFPSPMSMEESIQAFEHLGIYPQIELWRDHLRQWFSSVLLNPLLNKIENSHIQVHCCLDDFFYVRSTGFCIFFCWVLFVRGVKSG